MKVILISGKSASGKDTLANFMREEYTKNGKKVLTIHYADCVKFYARQYYRWNGEKDEAGRGLLQHLGTDRVRAKFPNYWADLVGQFLSAIDGDFDYVLIPDLRFYNEYKRVAKFNKNCITIRVNRLNRDGTYMLNSAMTEEQHKHPSECSLDDFSFDYMVDNSGSLDDLRAAAKKTIEMIEGEEND